MKKFFILLFFIILVPYLALLFSGKYVSVYITYYTLPTLAIIALFAFIDLKHIHETSLFIFVGTIILAAITAYNVSYIGVDLLPIVFSILITTGLIAFITRNMNKPN